MLDFFKINKKLYKQLDKIPIIIAIIIVLFSAFNLYSTTRIQSGIYYPKLQIEYLILGLIVSYVILKFDYYILGNYAFIFYWIGVIMLIYVKLSAKAVNGAQGWLKFGSRAIQPSEFVKLALILMLAKKIDDMEGNINNLKNLVILLIYAAIPMALVVIEPDMGMTMIYFFIVFGIVFMCNLNIKTIMAGLTSVFVLIVIVWKSGLIHDYQMGRLVSFLHPDEDLLGTGLQLHRGLVAIGSGGIIGKGFLKGNMIAGGFVPESFTDFIFTVVGEEWGLIGAIFLLCLYGILLYRILNCSKNSKDIFGKVICVGVFSSLLFSVFQNIGMTIGLMPISGLTLPFMSYGGSSIISNFIALALVLNVGMRRKKINF